MKVFRAKIVYERNVQLESFTFLWGPKKLVRLELGVTHVATLIGGGHVRQ